MDVTQPFNIYGILSSEVIGSVFYTILIIALIINIFLIKKGLGLHGVLYLNAFYFVMVAIITGWNVFLVFVVFFIAALFYYEISKFLRRG